MTKTMLAGAFLIAGLCSLTAGCSKEEVQAAGDKAGAMAEDAGVKAGELKDQFATWLKDNQGVLDQKLAELKAKSSEAGSEATAALEQRVADAKQMLARWKDVSADEWAEWSAKARDTVAELKADLQRAIDG
jgi:hypothetical protein